MKKTITVTLNGEVRSVDVEPNDILLDVIRDKLGVKSPKYGCGKGLCGSCTVLVDDKAVRSCVLPARGVAGKEVITIEGLATNGKLHPVQEAFVEHDALQCGICTPGMIMNAYSLLSKNPQPTRAEIIRGMEGNLCRCGAHTRIIDAIQSAGQEMRGAE